MTMKTCIKCGLPGSFHKDSSKKDGLRNVCKTCVRAYSVTYNASHRESNNAQCKAWHAVHLDEVKAKRHKWYEEHRETEIARTAALAKGDRQRVNATQRTRARQRRLLIASAKSHPCEDCKTTFPSYCMDFDHVRGEKRIIVSWMHKYSASAVLEEIEKCDLVCANCHKLRTDSRRPRTKTKRRVKFAEKMLTLKSKPCVDCKDTFPPFVMEFDHVRGEKVSCISEMRHSPWETVLVEVAKCDLVCTCCHHKRTHNRKHSQEAA